MSYMVQQFNNLILRMVLSQANSCMRACLDMFQHALYKLQLKWVIYSQAAEEAVYVRGILLAEKWVTRVWTRGKTLTLAYDKYIMKKPSFWMA
jgi:hypothetical protein